MPHKLKSNWKEKWFPKKLRKLYKWTTPKSEVETQLKTGTMPFGIASLIFSIMPEKEQQRQSKFIQSIIRSTTMNYGNNMFIPKGFQPKKNIGWKHNRLLKNREKANEKRGHAFSVERSCKLCSRKFVPNQTNTFGNKIYCDRECRVFFHNTYGISFRDPLSQRYCKYAFSRKIRNVHRYTTRLLLYRLWKDYNYCKKHNEYWNKYI